MCKDACLSMPNNYMGTCARRSLKNDIANLRDHLADKIHECVFILHWRVRWTTQIFSCSPVNTNLQQARSDGIFQAQETSMEFLRV